MKFCLTFAVGILLGLWAPRVLAADAGPVVAVAGARAVNSGELLGQNVRLRGVLSAVFRDDTDENYNWFIVRTSEGLVCAAVAENHHSLRSLRGLLDAEVEVSGVVRRFVNWRKFMGHLVSVSEIAVLKPAPSDPFEAPVFSSLPELHRVQVSGTVLARTDNRCFVRGEDGMFFPVKLSAGMAMPQAGERIDVAGFADHDLHNVQLSEAVWRPSHKMFSTAEEPVAELNMEDLFFWSGRRGVNVDVYGRVVCFSAVVSSFDEKRRSFCLTDAEGTVSVDLTGLPPLDLPDVGAKVEVTGVCFANFESDKSTMVFPRFRGFCIVPRNGRDVCVVRRAPWWTVERLQTGLSILAVVILFLTGLTIVLLRVLSRRVRELAAEQVASAQAELRVEERTCLAVELHDAISQSLTGIALQLDALDSAGAIPLPGRPFLSTARRMLDSCREELRGCLWDLRSRTFEEKDMTEAISRSLRPLLPDERLTVRFNVPREALTEQMVHTILKIVRELVANALRHGKANHVRIAGERHGSTLTFSVQDDGVGFSPEKAAGSAQGHFGLQGVRERLRAYDGTLAIESSASGSRIVVTMHLKMEEQA